MRKKIKKKITLDKVKVSRLNNLIAIRGATNNGLTCNSELIICTSFCGTNDNCI